MHNHFPVHLISIWNSQICALKFGGKKKQTNKWKKKLTHKYTRKQTLYWVLGDLLVLFLCLFCFFHRWFSFSWSGNYMQNQTISSKFKVAITVAIKQWMEFWDATNSYDVITSSQNNKHISNGRIEWHQFHRITTTTDIEWIEVGKKTQPKRRISIIPCYFEHYFVICVVIPLSD